MRREVEVQRLVQKVTSRWTCDGTNTTDTHKHNHHNHHNLHNTCASDSEKEKEIDIDIDKDIDILTLNQKSLAQLSKELKIQVDDSLHLTCGRLSQSLPLTNKTDNCDNSNNSNNNSIEEILQKGKDKIRCFDACSSHISQVGGGMDGGQDINVRGGSYTAFILNNNYSNNINTTNNGNSTSARLVITISVPGTNHQKQTILSTTVSSVDVMVNNHNNNDDNHDNNNNNNNNNNGSTGIDIESVSNIKFVLGAAQGEKSVCAYGCYGWGYVVYAVDYSLWG